MSSKSSSSSKKAKAAERAERAAALLAEQRRKENRRRFLMIAGVVAAMLLIIGGIVVYQLATRTEVTATATDNSLVVGETDAPHQVIIYEDFLCPICGIVETRAGERLTELAADGQVEVDYRPISILGRFGPYSADAANAFFVVQEEAGPEVAKEFHDLLFENQPSEEGPFPSKDDLIATAVDAGADEADVRDGIENDAMADTVEDATQEATDAGVEGTPTILLDGEEFSEGSSWEDIADNLVEAIED